jgi:hypothetical protein
MINLRTFLTTGKEKESIENIPIHLFISVAVGDPIIKRFRFRVMVFNTTFNNISAISW